MSELRVEGLVKEFQSSAETLRILDGIQLGLSEGQDISIVGPSGCGKSTLLYILGTLDQPTSGSVQLNEVDPFSLKPQELSDFRNEHIGFVFQDHHLLPQLSVLENVLLPAMAKGSPTKEALERAKHLIASVGLDERTEHLPAALSGGERQRVAVARALLQQPKLLLADEPTGNLDAKTTESVAELLFNLPKQEGSMLVVVTHSDWLAGQASQCLRLEQLQTASSPTQGA
ncbi:MAG: ABC transporter ATP-binding protein [Planctomycetota bacterium]